MTKLIIRLFGYEESRAVLTRKYFMRHWFMASDICGLLGITGYSQAVHRHLLPTEWKRKKEYTGTSNRQVLMVSESGLYKLIQLARSDRGQIVRERARRILTPLRPACWPVEDQAA